MLLDLNQGSDQEGTLNLFQKEYQIKIHFEEGQCIVFDNHRIVHGREAYAENSGDRYLRGCYIDRGELRSSYRTLVKKQQ